MAAVAPDAPPEAVRVVSLTYPDAFDETKLNVPAEPNVAFEFVVKAPKKYVFDTWNLAEADGGINRVLIPGSSEGAWPGIANGMERYVKPAKVIQKMGNVKTPEDGPWHFEFKVGTPYYKISFPGSLIMTAVHGSITLSDGPGENETTVGVSNRHKPGCCLCLTRCFIPKFLPTITKAAPARFAEEKYVGPTTMQR
jgi:hypothetical protein